MFKSIVAGCASASVIGSVVWATAACAQPLRVEPVATGLDTVWDMVWAPDGEMWLTERGGRVSRLDVASGRVNVVGEIPEVFEQGESGLMGMAFHPDFPREPWIYFVHSFGSEDAIKNRLIRVRYDDSRLGTPQTIIDNILGRRAASVERLFETTYGRLRDVLVGPDGSVYIATSNHDGRARGVGPFEGDDEILRIRPQ